MDSQVDKPARTPDSNLLQFPGGEPIDDAQIEIEIEPDEQAESEEPAFEASMQDFDGNLADTLSDDRKSEIAIRLAHDLDEDIASRSDWEKDYKDNLKYLGLKTIKKDKPWKGACGTTHPMMLEAIVRFQSRALSKLFPTTGPATLSVLSDEMTPDLQLAVDKAQKAFNLHITERMRETQTESDRLLFALADIGFAAKKVYFNEKLKRVVTQLVKAENFYLPYGFDNLELAPRFTEEVRRSRNEVMDLQRSGFYSNFPLVDGAEDVGEVEQAKADITGQTVSITTNDAYRLYEIYVDLAIEEDEHGNRNGSTSPYVVTIDKDANRLFAIRRNWKQQDEIRSKRINFIPYLYVPGDGSMGYGIVHLVGQLASSATKLLRQLVDSGTLANLPAFLKSKTARMTSQDPIQPGECRDVDVDPADLNNAFKSLPFKEPSLVLLELLKLIVGEGKSFASTADLEISSSSQNAPVGTTLALLERQTEVANAVQKRLHTSFKSELSTIAHMMAEFEEERYQAIFGQLEQMVGGMDNIIIQPAGDPTSSTLSQRVIQLQAVVQLAAQTPQIYDMAALHRTLISAMGVQDVNSLVPDKSKSQPLSIVEEHMAFLTGKPVHCFPAMDHKSHITAHMALLGDAYYQQMMAHDPQAAMKQAQIQADIAEHLAFDYRSQIEQQLGVQLPPVGQPQPPQVDAALSQLVATASQRVSQMHASQAQQQKAAEQAADPAYQLEKRQLDIKEKDVEYKHMKAQADLQHKDKALAEKTNVEVLRIVTSDAQAGEARKAQLASDALNHDREMHGMAADLGSRLLDNQEHGEQLDHQAELAEQQAQQQQQQSSGE